MKNLKIVALVLTAAVTLNAQCDKEEILTMVKAGYSSEKIDEICAKDGNTSSNEEQTTQKYKEQTTQVQKGRYYEEPAKEEKAAQYYFSVAGGLVSQGGFGFAFWSTKSETDTSYILQNSVELDVSGAGYFGELSFTADVYRLTLKQKALAYEWKNRENGLSVNPNVSETTLAFTQIYNKNGDIHLSLGAFIGFGNALPSGETNAAEFFTYGPQAGIIYDISDSLELFLDFTWQQRSYKEEYSTAKVEYENFPFGLDYGVRYNFR